jgi:hypothetical protein
VLCSARKTLLCDVHTVARTAMLAQAGGQVSNKAAAKAKSKSGTDAAASPSGSVNACFKDELIKMETDGPSHADFVKLLKDFSCQCLGGSGRQWKELFSFGHAARSRGHVCHGHECLVLVERQLQVPQPWAREAQGSLRLFGSLCQTGDW